jgi:predicted nucleic acid-binding Zn ribbon protein
MICGKDVPEKRRNQTVCSDECGYEKMAAWDLFLRVHSMEMVRAAIREYKQKQQAET